MPFMVSALWIPSYSFNFVFPEQNQYDSCVQIQDVPIFHIMWEYGFQDILGPTCQLGFAKPVAARLLQWRFFVICLE